jgi:hypothetical protein
MRREFVIPDAVAKHGASSAKTTLVSAPMRMNAVLNDVGNSETFMKEYYKRLDRSLDP